MQNGNNTSTVPRSSTVIDKQKFESYSLRKILNNEVEQMSQNMIKTKIIVTIGPSCDSKEMIKALVAEGMTLFRINIAHVSIDQIRNSIKIIHDTFKQKKCSRYSIIIDTEGCFPRTGHLENEQEIEFSTGDEVTLVVDHQLIGNKQTLGCNIDNLTRCVRIGDKVYLAEGKIIGQVISTQKD